jgi:voltage-gated potassium channel
VIGRRSPEPAALTGRAPWRRPIITSAGLLVAYYSVPSVLAANAEFFIGLLVTAAALVVLAWAIIGQVRRQLVGGTDIALQSLLTLIELVIVVFAYAFYALERSRSGEVAGLETRTDALYFTMTTMTTVGYGDIHASGQVARVLVLVQLAFNIVFVGALVRIAAGLVQRRAAERRTTHNDDKPD